MRPEAQPWARLTPRDAVRLLDGLPLRWWIAGGWALDLALGRQTRTHKDVDIAVLRPDHEQLRRFLGDWDLQIAHEGALRPWRSGPVGPPERSVWARRTPDEAWLLDFKIELVEGDEWVYRRDPTVRRKLADMGRTTDDGIPYLEPQIVRLYAS